MKGFAAVVGVSRGALRKWIDKLGSGATADGALSPGPAPHRPLSQSVRIARLKSSLAASRAESEKLTEERDISLADGEAIRRGGESVNRFQFAATAKSSLGQCATHTKPRAVRDPHETSGSARPTRNSKTSPTPEPAKCRTPITRIHPYPRHHAKAPHYYPRRSNRNHLHPGRPLLATDPRQRRHQRRPIQPVNPCKTSGAG